jgi:prepilin-type N-terminal cleavage/methylation domain-containing protein
MKTNHQKHSGRGMTLVEVLVVIGVIAVLAALLLPALAKSGRSRRISCISNLKQIGLAFRMWANDHDNQMPWQVSREKGGTLELVADGSVLPHFLAISNELNSPKPLTCSSDAARSKAIVWHVSDIATQIPHALSVAVATDSEHYGAVVDGLARGILVVAGTELLEGLRLDCSFSQPLMWLEELLVAGLERGILSCRCG